MNLDKVLIERLHSIVVSSNTQEFIIKLIEGFLEKDVSGLEELFQNDEIYYLSMSQRSNLFDLFTEIIHTLLENPDKVHEVVSFIMVNIWILSNTHCDSVTTKFEECILILQNVKSITDHLFQTNEDNKNTHAILILSVIMKYIQLILNCLGVNESVNEYKVENCKNCFCKSLRFLHQSIYDNEFNVANSDRISLDMIMLSYCGKDYNDELQEKYISNKEKENYSELPKPMLIKECDVSEILNDYLKLKVCLESITTETQPALINAVLLATNDIIRVATNSPVNVSNEIYGYLYRIWAIGMHLKLHKELPIEMQLPFLKYDLEDNSDPATFINAVMDFISASITIERGATNNYQTGNFNSLIEHSIELTLKYSLKVKDVQKSYVVDSVSLIGKQIEQLTQSIKCDLNRSSTAMIILKLIMHMYCQFTEPLQVDVFKRLQLTVIRPLWEIMNHFFRDNIKRNSRGSEKEALRMLLENI